MFESLIFPRDNFIKRGDLRQLFRIQRGRVYNPAPAVPTTAAWVNTEAVTPGYNGIQFNGETVGYVTVDWGDGSQPELVGPTGPHSFTHIYSQAGKYLINISFGAGNGFYWTGEDVPGLLGRQIIKSYIDRVPPSTPPSYGYVPSISAP